MRTTNPETLFRLPSRARVAYILETMTPVEWMILETRLEVGDPLLTMEERDALVMHEVQRTLVDESSHGVSYAPPRFPPRVPHPDC